MPRAACTVECQSDAECRTFAPDAACNGTVCIEGCLVGPETDAADKCSGRHDVGCRYFTSEATTESCSTDSECGNSAVCDGGQCLHIVTACQPSCRSDADCDGAFCNLGTGLCQEQRPVGKRIGEPCASDAAQDECQGLCIGDGSGQSAVCSGYCRFGDMSGCGWDGTGPADAACFFLPAFLQSFGAGDVGYCAELCDCTTECRDPAAQCVSLSQSAAGREYVATFARLGVCARAAAGDVPLDRCPADGSAGMGGAGGASGAGGENTED